MRTLWIGVAGFAGAVSRSVVDNLVTARTRNALPWGTLVVNVTGCLVLGFLVTLFTRRYPAHEALRVALTVGFVGAYTTFSTFAYQALALGQDRRAGAAALYVAGSIVLGIAAAWLGTVAARAV